MLTGINLEAARGAEAVVDYRALSEDNWRYGGFFGNVNTMSAFYVMIVPASIYFLISDKSILNKLIAGVAVVAMIISLLLGASRGGLLFLGSNIIISLFFIKIKLKNVIFAFVSLITIGFILNYLLDQYFIEYLTRAFDEMARKGTDSPREMIWYYTSQIIFDHPFGLGLSTENYTIILRQYSNSFWSNPHNVYLEMTTQTGIAGLIVFMSIVIRTLWKNIKSYYSSVDPIMKESLAIVFIMMTGFLLMGFTEPIFRNQYKLNHVFALLIGFSLSLSSRFGNLNNNQENITLKEPI
jgi:O-antigen ligase